MADAAPDEAPQDVALAEVGRLHSLVVAEDEGGGAHVVRDDPEGRVGRRLGPVALSRDLRQALDDGPEQLGLEDSFLPLEHGDGPVHSHARVHGLLRKGEILAVRRLVVLHEDVVPDLEVFPAVASRLAGRSAGGNARVNEHLRVRPAGSGLPAGAPPVVLAGEEVDAALRNPHLLPEPRGLVVRRNLVVSGEDRDGKHVRGKAEPLRGGEKLVAETDGVILEIIAEGPVAQHLEEREMRRVPHFFYVVRADALLAVDQALARGVRLSQDVGDKGMHARRGEKNGGVIFRDQGLAGYLRVPFSLEKIDVFSLQLDAGHGS